MPKRLHTEGPEANGASKRLRQAALPEWLAIPLQIEQDEHELLETETEGGHTVGDLMPPSSSSLAQNCSRLGIKNLFAVQRCVIPLLCDPLADRDLLVSAPTGSGKTLAYAIPLVHALASRTVPRLRALVVVPTRDLALQVTEVFVALAAGARLKVAHATGGSSGHRSFASEQQILCGRRGPATLPPRMVQAALEYMGGGDICDGIATDDGFGRSAVDVLVATPGRLLDHLAETAGFTLQHLEFLVLDEADRVLSAPFSDCLRQIIAACNDTTADTHRRSTLRARPIFGYAPQYAPHRPIKLLFSATITRNPEKIAMLRLVHPLLITTIQSAKQNKELPANAIAQPESVPSKYVFPTTLREYMVTLYTATDKPIALIELLSGNIPAATEDSNIENNNNISNSDRDDDNDENGDSKERTRKPHLADRLGIKTRPPRVLVFTKSAESARRLAGVLARALEQTTVDFFSRELPQARRTEILTRFRKAAVSTGSGKDTCSVSSWPHVLVASDVIARGIDLPSVDVVVNYDHPNFLPQYVHRVGRTARAGTQGTAVSLIAAHEARFFKDLMAKRGAAWRQTVHQVRFRSSHKRYKQLVSILESLNGDASAENDACPTPGDDDDR